MVYDAKAYKVMIASPSDVHAERQVARDVIHEWNSVHAEDKRIVLLPVGWETHSAPSMEARAQQVINEQVLTDCDLLVAVFWTRLGSPTGSSASGTVEEIEKHLAAGKPAMIYFSNTPVRPDSVEEQQYRALRDFRNQCEERGLIETYGSLSEFREKFTRQLALTIIRIYAASTGDDTNAHARVSVAVPETQVPRLSADSQQLLVEVAKDKHGIVLCVRTMDGLHIEANGRDFVEPQDARSQARWEGALDELRENDLLRDEGYKGEVFRLTAHGYEVADKLVAG